MINRFSRKAIMTLLFASVMVVLSVASAFAYSNGVSYKGQGLTPDGFGGYDLNKELCGAENGADAEGPYLLFVLTATGAENADITIFGVTYPMTKTGNGAFKYVSPWIDPDTLVGNVSASYDGKAKNAQLVVSHGCRPFETEGAWCSPGFWKNAKDEAWAVTGHSKTEPFNETVFNIWYGATFAAAPTLETVLNNPPTYSGPPVAGTSGYALNAFNATGAYLTNSIPGFHFDWDVMKAGGSDACPIDHHGNLK